MDKKKTLVVLISGALVVAAVVGVVAYRSVNAAVAPTQNIIANSGFGFGPFGHQNGNSNQYLADALGITTDQLNTAYQTASNAALDQAVKAGLITQAQADQLKSNGEVFPFGGRWEGFLAQNGIDFNALLANALGITTDQLQAAYLKAYNARIDQAVTDGQLTQDQANLMKGEYTLFNNQNFQSSMKSAFEAAVAQAVSDGVITQAQADQILKNSNNMGFLGLHGFGEFKGFEGFGPEGGHRGGFGRGGWEGNPNNLPANPSTPSTPTAPSSGGGA